MARWVEGERPGRGFYVNTAIATCELCDVDLEPGEARLWRCRGCANPDHNVLAPRNPRGGVHARCRDEQACRRRQTPKAPTRRELAAALRPPPGPAQEPAGTKAPTALRPSSVSCGGPGVAQPAPAPIHKRRTHVE